MKQWSDHKQSKGSHKKEKVVYKNETLAQIY